MYFPLSAAATLYGKTWGLAHFFCGILWATKLLAAFWWFSWWHRTRFLTARSFKIKITYHHPEPWASQGWLNRGWQTWQVYRFFSSAVHTIHSWRKSKDDCWPYTTADTHSSMTAIFLTSRLETSMNGRRCGCSSSIRYIPMRPFNCFLGAFLGTNFEYPTWPPNPDSTFLVFGWKVFKQKKLPKISGDSWFYRLSRFI